MTPGARTCPGRKTMTAARPAVPAVEGGPGGQRGGFRDFISRGNVSGLAVAVVIGTALTPVVTAFVADIITR